MSTFFLQAIKHFKTIGALTPSSSILCDALTHPTAGFSHANILEVGSGNGVIAQHLIHHYGSSIHELWVNEINATLFQECEKNLQYLYPSSMKLHLHQGAFEDMPIPEHYFDMIISSLPLNSLSCAEVKCILNKLKQVLKKSPSSTLCFYEHIGSRVANKMHSLISTEQSFTQVFTHTFDGWECSSNLVLRNFPPAIVWKIKPPAIGA